MREAIVADGRLTEFAEGASFETQSQTEAVRAVGQLGNGFGALADALQTIVDRVGEHVATVDRAVFLGDHRLPAQLFRFCQISIAI